MTPPELVPPPPTVVIASAVSDDSFNPEYFTIVPNEILTLVTTGKLHHRDIATYAFFLGRSGAMLALKKGDYAALSEKKIAALLGCSVRTHRASVKRLHAAGIIERLDTRGNTRTRVLVAVKDGKVVHRPAIFPVKQRDLSCTGERHEDTSETDFFEESAVW